MPTWGIQRHPHAYARGFRFDHNHSLSVDVVFSDLSNPDYQISAPMTWWKQENDPHDPTYNAFNEILGNSTPYEAQLDDLTFVQFKPLYTEQLISTYWLLVPNIVNDPFIDFKGVSSGGAYDPHERNTTTHKPPTTSEIYHQIVSDGYKVDFTEIDENFYDLPDLFNLEVACSSGCTPDDSGDDDSGDNSDDDGSDSGSSGDNSGNDGSEDNSSDDGSGSDTSGDNSEDNTSDDDSDTNDSDSDNSGNEGSEDSDDSDSDNSGNEGSEDSDSNSGNNSSNNDSEDSSESENSEDSSNSSDSGENSDSDGGEVIVIDPSLGGGSGSPGQAEVPEPSQLLGAVMVVLFMIMQFRKRKSKPQFAANPGEKA